MKWLITGGSGQLASTLSILLERENTPFLAPNKRTLDITESGAEKQIIRINPTLIVNCAAFTDVELAEYHKDDAFKINAVGPGMLAEVAKKIGIPFIHISTDYVFAGDVDKEWTIKDNKVPASVYGKSKLQGEVYVNEIYPEGSIIFRTAWLYSEFGSNFITKIMSKLNQGGEVIRIVNDQYGQPTSALSLASRIIEVAKSPITPGIYHATNSGRATRYDFAMKFAELAGISTSRFVGVASKDFASKFVRPQFTVLDNSCWSETDFPALPSWEVALEEVLPRIIGKAV